MKYREEDVLLEMAKISRRAVSSLSSPSFSSSSIATETTSLVSISSTSTASKSTTNANHIDNGGKSTELSGKVSVTFTHSNAAAAISNPLPLNGSSGTQLSANGSRGSSTGTPTAGSNEHKFNTARTTPIFGANNASPSPPTYHHNKTQAQLIADEQDKIRAEFFATYDVMTGVRIAATLSGFFGLMVFLIVWKSRSSSNETLKVLKDPKMAAVAAVCMQEEEEREIQEAMVATGMSIYPDEYDAILYRRQRMLSLGNVSAPPMLNRGFRFSSVGGGGYSSLLEPPRRFSYSAASGAGSLGGGRRKSGSESSRILSNYPMGSSFGNDDYFIETEDELECIDYLRNGSRLDDLQNTHKRTDSTKSKRGFLEVPPAGVDSRRSSAMTCCSTESSYLERRCSAFTLGLTNLPQTLQRKLSTASRTSSTDNWDYYYPDIQVIQPTPKPSPCPSERSLYEQLQARANTATTGATNYMGFERLTAAAQLPVTPEPTTSRTSGVQNVAKDQPISCVGPVQAEGEKFIRKHSIAYYDPESAQAGRKQEIHSISADTVDIYPYNRALFERDALIYDPSNMKPALQASPPTNVRYGFHFSDSSTDEPRTNLRGKLAVVELQRLSQPQEQLTSPSNVSSGGTVFENNNTFPYSSSAAAITTTPSTAPNAITTANSSSISIDSTPISIDKLNGSGSFGTISVKAIFNAEKRAPLASLSSFKISSLEYQDSEARSVEEDSVFLDSVADTDEDMRQLSSDSEEISLSEHDPNFMSENTTLVSKADIDAPPILCSNQQTIKHPNEKRFSLGTTNVENMSVSHSRRPLLARHRTISVSSSDRVALIGHQLKEFHHGSDSQTPMTVTQSMPLETHFGSIICTNNSPIYPRRAQLLQQYSDPQSMPTTTTTTTTTTTEEDTCCTLNTELYGGGIGGSSGGICGEGSTTHTQHSSLNTVISFGLSSPLTDNNQTTYDASAGATSLPPTKTNIEKNQTNKTPQLPRNRFTDDPCASSISDSIISTTRHATISMPSTLKNLILRGTSTMVTEKPEARAAASTLPTVSRSATNLSLLETNTAYEERTSGAVMLELPLIKLPTDDSSDSSNASDGNEKELCKSDESHDTGLASTSRKWSKETLF